jgi:hypothetical protein
LKANPERGYREPENLSIIFFLALETISL